MKPQDRAPGRHWVFKGHCGSLEGEKRGWGGAYRRAPSHGGRGEAQANLSQVVQMEGRGWPGKSRGLMEVMIVATLDVELEVGEPSSRSGRAEGDGGSSGGDVLRARSTEALGRA